jgi:5-methyltetrahydrofolate--homocysteine methyltransferase
MMQAATAAQSGFEVIKEHLAATGAEQVSKGTVVLATVKGDIHDIGKNIVKVIMENYGFDIIDLGRDVPPEKVVETVVSKNIRLVGLSALMTTTLGSMEDTIAAVKTAAPECKVMVGGAVLTPDFAERIGADYYCKDAMKSVEAANEVFA